MRTLGAALLLIGLTACKPRPPVLRTAQGQGFSLQYDPAAFRDCRVTQAPRLTMTEIGTDVPVDNGPARAQFTFTMQMPGFMKGGSFPAEGHLWVIPLADASVGDFDKEYPGLRGEARLLRELTATHQLRPAFGKELPDWSAVDARQTIHAQVQFLDTRWMSGLLYLTQYTQESGGNPINNEELSFVFQGLSRDGNYLIAAELPIAHPSLPADVDASNSITRDPQEQYLKDAEARLNASPDSFSPSLASLRQLLGSLHPAE